MSARPRHGAPASIYVCGLAGLEHHVAALEAEALVSVVAADEQPPTPAGLAPGQHLRLELDDIEEPFPGLLAPAPEHVAALIDFAGGWRGDGPLLIHCAAGISRSTAAALACLCLHSDADEAALARRLRRAAPHARPNRRLVALADARLGRAGRLIAAVEAMGPPVAVFEGPLVRLPLAAD